MKATVAVALLAVMLGVVANEAHAFRTTRDLPEAAGVTNAVRWPSAMPTIRVNAQGSADLAIDDVVGAATLAFAHWTDVACADVHPQVAGTSAVDLAAEDGEAIIAWRESGWAALGYSPAEIAVTRLEYVHDTATSWSIGGADIAMNGENYTWVLEGGMAGSDHVDVETLLTHEAGHFLGLAHTCEAGGAAGAPACGLLMPTIAPTMTPNYFGQQGRTLEADDIDGICFLYPAPPSEDADISDDGCASVDASASDASDADASSAQPASPDCSCRTAGLGTNKAARAFTLVLAVLLLLMRRRRGHDGLP